MTNAVNNMKNKVINAILMVPTIAVLVYSIYTHIL